MRADSFTVKKKKAGKGQVGSTLKVKKFDRRAKTFLKRVTLKYHGKGISMNGKTNKLIGLANVSFSSQER